MLLHELRSLLTDYSDRHFRIRLPEGDAIPLSFHVTEIGHVHKTFLDCGGTRREIETCQLQIWVGEDYNHRIETEKMAAILERGKTVIPDDTVPVEIEYEDQVISQYTISNHEITDEAVILDLAHKHTECLAPELCGLPTITRLPAIDGKGNTLCGISGCC
jgi:hypothetical protein